MRGRGLPSPSYLNVHIDVALGKPRRLDIELFVGFEVVGEFL